VRLIFFAGLDLGLALVFLLVHPLFFLPLFTGLSYFYCISFYFCIIIYFIEN
jgi:hypothetical protein